MRVSGAMFIGLKGAAFLSTVEGALDKIRTFVCPGLEKAATYSTPSISCCESSCIFGALPYLWLLSTLLSL